MTRSEKIYARRQAISADTLLNGIYPSPTDNATKTIYEFSSYIQQLTNDIEDFEIGDYVTTEMFGDKVFEVVGIRRDEVQLEGEWFLKENCKLILI